MAEQGLQPGRIRIARELRGFTQADLARRLDITASAFSQFEAGATRPGPATLQKLAEALQVPPAFFAEPVVESHEGFFRSLRRTAVIDRRRARAIAQLAHDLATSRPAADILPPISLPTFPVMAFDESLDTEQIAEDTRRALHLGPGPVPHLVDLLEARGLAIIRMPLNTPDVDAFSVPFPDRPVVVLGADKNDRARSRFDLAHELGHLVMHGNEVWGMPEVERQAHSFAAALLMPRDQISREFPDHMDWPRFFALKRRWQVSLGALLLRAKSIGRLSEASYLTAVKAASARGWRRAEPIPLGEPEQPRWLTRALSKRETAEVFSWLPESIIEDLAQAAIPSR